MVAKDRFRITVSSGITSIFADNATKWDPHNENLYYKIIFLLSCMSEICGVAFVTEPTAFKLCYLTLYRMEFMVSTGRHT